MSTTTLTLLADDACPDCVESHGLCQRHARGVLPQLAQPAWVRLIGVQAMIAKPEQPSPEAARVIARKARRTAKRLARAVMGAFTPVRRAA